MYWLGEVNRVCCRGIGGGYFPRGLMVAMHVIISA
jgi:hypothetical protein